MKLDIRRPKALPHEKPHLRTHEVGTAQLQRNFGLSDDVTNRIMRISHTTDQARAIAELMK